MTEKAAISHQRSAVSCQPSAVSCQPSEPRGCRAVRSLRPFVPSCLRASRGAAPQLRAFVPSCLRASRSSASRPAFTLVELIVVIGIISILVVSVLPILGALYRDTRGADAANRIQGLLKSARMRALGGMEAGLFFYVEPDTNIQRVVFIQAEPPDPRTPLSPGVKSPDTGVGPECAVDRFRVLEENVYTLPPPFRAAPLAVLKEPSDGGEWSDTELANNDYDDTGVIFTESGPQNHRNFFTIIFSPEGRLVVNRSVLIHDPVADREDRDAHFKRGKVTLLDVNATGNRQPAGDGPGPEPLNCELPAMIATAATRTPAALNFPSVAGLLVYDDSLFGEFPGSDERNPDVVDKREFLRQRGQPIYISPQTGDIVLGPIGEERT